MPDDDDDADGPADINAGRSPPCFQPDRRGCGHVTALSGILVLVCVIAISTLLLPSPTIPPSHINTLTPSQRAMSIFDWWFNWFEINVASAGRAHTPPANTGTFVVTTQA